MKERCESSIHDIFCHSPSIGFFFLVADGLPHFFYSYSTFFLLSYISLVERAGTTRFNFHRTFPLMAGLTTVRTREMEYKTSPIFDPFSLWSDWIWKKFIYIFRGRVFVYASRTQYIFLNRVVVVDKIIESYRHRICCLLELIERTFALISYIDVVIFSCTLFCCGWVNLENVRVRCEHKDMPWISI